MKAYFLKKIPLDGRTVFFALSASGAVSFPAAIVLRGFGYPGLDTGHPVGLMVMLIAFIETITLPVAAILFQKIEPSLALLGVLLFCVVFCGAMLFPAVS